MLTNVRRQGSTYRPDLWRRETYAVERREPQPLENTVSESLRDSKSQRQQRHRRHGCVSQMVAIRTAEGINCFELYPSAR